MRTSFKLFAILLVGALVAIPGCDDTEEVEEPGVLVGDWQLTSLTASYLRTAVAPPGAPADTTYSLTASWNLAADVLGAASAADQELASFSVGDTVFATTKAFDSAALAAYGISLELGFLEDSTYTFSGAYPTLRLDMAACSTYLATPTVQDVGKYTVTYYADETGGTLGIFPNDLLGDQVLPSFDDGTVTFTNAGETLQLDFLDRDGHDVLIAQTGETWDEEEHRVTMGIPEAPILSSLGIFATADVADTTGKSAYLYDPVKLAGWGGFLTFYALAFEVESTYLLMDPTSPIYGVDVTQDGTIDASDAVAYMVSAPSAISKLQLPYGLLVTVDTSGAVVITDDSASDFDPASPGTGGKLTYVINNVCIPVNELIDFKSSWDKHAH